jgi:hypothetical protein
VGHPRLNAVAEADAVVPEHAVRHDLPVGWVHRTETSEEGAVVDSWFILSTVPKYWGNPHSIRPAISTQQSIRACCNDPVETLGGFQCLSQISY